jgi:hypothetical protein
MRTVVPVDSDARLYIENWMDQAQDPATGNGGMPAKYQRNFSVFELGPDGTPSRCWEYTKAFPVSYKVNAKSSLDDSTDVLEFMEMAYNKRELRIF